MAKTEKMTVTFRIEKPKVAALDELADSLQRDRSFLLNAAVDAYLELHSWQLNHAEDALDEANEGQVDSPQAVNAALERMRRNLKG